jgi:UDP-GlcNAc:undecaprenyl-phosphate/decaprenyl-phosphate GlcNAc-1-phosphate transferase
VREYLLTLLVTAAVTYILTPLVRRIAIRGGAMHEARDRDVHVVPIPLWGGLAMYVGLGAGLLVASMLSPLDSVLSGSGTAPGLLLAGGLIVAIGIVDDRWGMNAISKLAGQVAAGAILVASGCELGWLPLPDGKTYAPTSNQAMVLTVLVVVATINAVNFIDGLDGLAAGIVAIAAIAFFLYYYSLAHSLRLSAEAQPALAAAVLAGMCLGFLPHNFYPARIFMGDTGSMLLGLLLAYVPISSITLLDPRTLAANVNRFPEVLPLLLPLTILVIPYADMLMAVIRRTRAGMSPFAPDRKHLHHRLLDIGHSHRLSVLIMYLWAALFSGLIIWFSTVRTPLFVFGVITLGAIVALLLMSMPRLRWWTRARRPVAAGATPAVANLAAVASPAGMTAAAVAAAGSGTQVTSGETQVADGGSPPPDGGSPAAEPGDRRAARPAGRAEAVRPRSVVGTLPPASAYADAAPLAAPVPNGTVANGTVTGNGNGSTAPAEPASRDVPAPDLLTQETMPIPVYDPAARPADRPPSRGR